MASILSELGIDCQDPRGLARFWQQVLDYVVVSEEAGLVSIAARPEASPLAATETGSVTLTFAWVPEGKIVKNRLHLDVRPQNTGQREEVERLINLGASVIDIGQGQRSWVVMADPEGNEFCVLAALP